MSQTAAHLVDHVIPHVPVRQWVLSLPIPLRVLLAAQPELVTPVLQVVQRVLTRHPRAAGDREDPDPPGAGSAAAAQGPSARGGAGLKPPEPRRPARTPDTSTPAALPGGSRRRCCAACRLDAGRLRANPDIEAERAPGLQANRRVPAESGQGNDPGAGSKPCGPASAAHAGVTDSGYARPARLPRGSSKVANPHLVESGAASPSWRVPPAGVRSSSGPPSRKS